MGLRGDRVAAMPRTSLPATIRMATLARAWRLLRAFGAEQTSPADFYQPLAADTRALVEALASDFGVLPDAHGGLTGARILDVGCGPGYFATAFEDCTYVGLDSDRGELLLGQDVGTRGHFVCADAHRLPFPDDSFDIVYSSNAAEHLPNWQQMADEMVRVTRPGGLTVISYTVWLGPFGGHETGLWEHYVGGEFAARRYTRRHGHPPKNRFGQSLFAVSAAEGLAWLARTKAQYPLTVAIPRYHPAWAWWVTRVPILREFLTSNLVLVLAKPRE